MSQVSLARAVGVSESLVRQYESGRRVSDPVLDKLKSYAVEQGRADLAALFDPQPFSVRKVLLPPKAGSAIDPHSLLDEVLQSDDVQVKLAVEQLLFITTQYLRGVR